MNIKATMVPLQGSKLEEVPDIECVICNRENLVRQFKSWDNMKSSTYHNIDKYQIRFLFQTVNKVAKPDRLRYQFQVCLG